MNDYQLYQLLESNGYETTKENLEILKENLETGNTIILTEGINKYSQEKVMEKQAGMKTLTAPILLSIFFSPLFLIWLGYRVVKNDSLSGTTLRDIRQAVGKDEEAMNIKRQLDAAISKKDKKTAKQLSLEFANRVQEVVSNTNAQ